MHLREGWISHLPPNLSFSSTLCDFLPPEVPVLLVSFVSSS